MEAERPEESCCIKALSAQTAHPPDLGFGSLIGEMRRNNQMISNVPSHFWLSFILGPIVFLSSKFSFMEDLGPNVHSQLISATAYFLK